MTSGNVRELVRGYYRAWAAGDRAGVRRRLADDLRFHSRELSFTSADAFLDCCWKYSEGLTGVDFQAEVYEDTRAFLLLRWHTGDGAHFAGAEYVVTGGDRLSEIFVVNNDPALTPLADGAGLSR